jgi:hypothetical protein
MKKKEMQCDVCRKTANKKCCEHGTYCGESCQKSDWKTHQIHHVSGKDVGDDPVIILNILKKMSVTKLIEVALVNKQWQMVARSNQLWRERYEKLRTEENFLFLFFDDVSRNLSRATVNSIRSYPRTDDNISYFREFMQIWSALPHAWLNPNSTHIGRLGWWDLDQTIDFAWIHLGPLGPVLKRRTVQNHFSFGFGRIAQWSTADGTLEIGSTNHPDVDFVPKRPLVSRFLARYGLKIGTFFTLAFAAYAGFGGDIAARDALLNYMTRSIANEIVFEGPIYAQLFIAIAQIAEILLDIGSIEIHKRVDLIVTKDEGPATVYRNGEKLELPNVWFHIDTNDLMAESIK